MTLLTDAGVGRTDGTLDAALVERALRLCSAGAVFLEHVWSDSLALFPYSTRRIEGRLANDYDHPQTIRYTINTLLGLKAAHHAGMEPASVPGVDAFIERFLRRQYESISSTADHGLLLLLLCDGGFAEHAAVRRSLERLETSLRSASATDFNMQDLAWISWGSVAAARSGIHAAAGTAAAAHALITDSFVDPKSSMPRHSASRYRRNIVSFGSLVYFLRAMHEYSGLTGDERARELFSRGVTRALTVQGPLGEWPWMIHVDTGRPFDPYPVFTVHQDSMSLLFLFPALDEGIDGVGDAIERSFEWALGRNELATPMLVDDPFWGNRSIERAERFPRGRRYLRSFAAKAAKSRSAVAARPRVRINPECRSYHVGWLIYVWSSRLGREAHAAHATGPNDVPRNL